MAGINEHLKDMLFPLSFSRQFSGPLDSKEVWYDLEALKNYAKSTTSGSYAGQIVKYIDKSQSNKITIYTIEANGNLTVSGVTDAQINRWNDTYTKTEINSKIDNLEAGRVWKPSVDTFSKIAETYLNPQDTWCVITKDTNIIWMYDAQKSQWIDLGHSVIHDNATTAKDGLMSKEDKNKLDNIESTINNKVKPVSDKLNTVESTYKSEDTKIRQEFATADATLDSKITALSRTHSTDKTELEKKIQDVNSKFIAATEEQINSLFFLAIIGDKKWHG